jgi:hypothetical protein
MRVSSRPPHPFLAALPFHLSCTNSNSHTYSLLSFFPLLADKKSQRPSKAGQPSEQDGRGDVAAAPRQRNNSSGSASAALNNTSNRRSRKNSNASNGSDGVKGDGTLLLDMPDLNPLARSPLDVEEPVFVDTPDRYRGSASASPTKRVSASASPEKIYDNVVGSAAGSPEKLYDNLPLSGLPLADRKSSLATAAAGRRRSSSSNNNSANSSSNTNNSNNKIESVPANRRTSRPSALPANTSQTAIASSKPDQAARSNSNGGGDASMPVSPLRKLSSSSIPVMKQSMTTPPGSRTSTTATNLAQRPSMHQLLAISNRPSDADLSLSFVGDTTMDRSGLEPSAADVSTAESNQQQQQDEDDKQQANVQQMQQQQQQQQDEEEQEQQEEQELPQTAAAATVMDDLPDRLAAGTPSEMQSPLPPASNAGDARNDGDDDDDDDDQGERERERECVCVCVVCVCERVCV